jgi:hypothetical protein
LINQFLCPIETVCFNIEINIHVVRHVLLPIIRNKFLGMSGRDEAEQNCKKD